MKNKNLLPAKKFRNVLAFDKQSYRKLVSLISADSFIKNNLLIYNNFRVEKSLKNFFRYYGFSGVINVFCETVGKCVCITRTATDRHYSK